MTKFKRVFVIKDFSLPYIITASDATKKVIIYKDTVIDLQTEKAMNDPIVETEEYRIEKTENNYYDLIFLKTNMGIKREENNYAYNDYRDHVFMRIFPHTCFRRYHFVDYPHLTDVFVYHLDKQPTFKTEAYTKEKKKVEVDVFLTKFEKRAIYYIPSNINPEDILILKVHIKNRDFYYARKATNYYAPPEYVFDNEEEALEYVFS